MDIFWKWMPLIITGVQLTLAWVIWSARKEFIRRDECTTCAGTLLQRVSAVESGLDSLPASKSWRKMQVAIDEVRASNGVVLAKLEGQSELLKRIEHPMNLLMEHHLRGDK